MSWDQFYMSLQQQLQRDLAPFQADLQYALGMDEKVRTVSPQQMGVFLTWFGPLRGCLDNVRTLLLFGLLLALMGKCVRNEG